MFPRPKTKKAVWLYTAIASMCSVVVTLFLVPIGFAGEVSGPMLLKSAMIALSCSVPTTWILWNEMRKNEELVDELQTLVNRDRLTDVATRDYFFNRMSADPEAYGVSLMIDIDKFKLINDTFGHFAGDEVIREVATVLAANIREDDIVCRFGGEEFVIFLHNYHQSKGLEVAEDLRRMVEAMSLTYEGQVIDVTVSIGGSLKQRIETIDNAIKEADAALYRAKNSGRNRTIFAASG